MPRPHQTATLSRKVLPDLLKILGLAPLTDGRGEYYNYSAPCRADARSRACKAAKRSGTVFFKAPLYRPNLHYSVLPKPANAKAAIDAIAEWILQNHE
jgi:ATP-dependent DNA helicase Q1